jgi:hypothetical protein
MSILENPSLYEITDIEYAADLPSHKYGSAFSIRPDLNDSDD